MRVNSISVLNYKNLSDVNIGLSAKINCFIGNNGMGKTTAMRSARLILADMLHMEQKSISKRLLLCAPLFAISLGLLVFSIINANGFTIIWRYFSWCNQTLSVFTLWAITVYLVIEKKNYFVTYVPALFMTYVVTTYICIAPEGFRLPESLSYAIGTFFTIIAVAWFNMWRNNKLEIKK